MIATTSDKIIVPQRAHYQEAPRPQWGTLVLIGALFAGLFWIANGFYVAVGLPVGKVSTNAWTHTITKRVEGLSGPDNEWKFLGTLIGARLMAPVCDELAAKVPGFGWRLEMVGDDNMPIMSCWSWR